MKEIISKVNALDDVLGKVQSLWELEKEKEHNILQSIPNRTIKDVSSTDIKGIKHSFGKLFYGTLCPINGVSPNNKRFSDGGNDYIKATYGPCVWKQIGKKNTWSSRANWYTYDSVFDNLKTEHIDLVINGLRNRKDQIDVAKELFLIREEIQEHLKCIEQQDSTGKELLVSLSKSYEIKMVLTHLNMDKIELPCYEASIKVKDIIINESMLRIPVKLASTQAQELKDSFNIDTTSYQFSSYVQIPLLENVKEMPKGNASWGVEYYIFGISDLIQDSTIDNVFNNMLGAKKKAIEILEKMQTKYSGRMLANGML